MAADALAPSIASVSVVMALTAYGKVIIVFSGETLQ